MTKMFLMTVKRVAGLLLIVSISAFINQSESYTPLADYCAAFNQVQLDIRDGAISPDSARNAFSDIMRNIRKIVKPDTCRGIDSAYFVYPVESYLPRESVGSRGRGFRPNGFDLFDREVAGSHPAHDLFVRDKDQDNLDDRTWKPINVLSFSSGIVLATETGWKYDSELRGGNWIWVYDPCLDGLFYYAHNNIVEVQPGQSIKAGDKIAEMGRSGYNAYKKRSPTHVHLMYLQLDSLGMPEPYDTYEWLLQAVVKSDPEM